MALIALRVVDVIFAFDIGGFDSYRAESCKQNCTVYK